MSSIKIVSEKSESMEECIAGTNDACPDGKYWVRPYTRKRTDKNGKVTVQSVKGYCSSYHDHFHARLQQPGKHDPFDRRAWEDSKKIMEEIRNAPEEKNPLTGVCHYFSGAPNVKKHPWQKNYFDLPDVPHFHFVKLKD